MYSDEWGLCVLCVGVRKLKQMVCIVIQGGVSEEGGGGCAPLPSWLQPSHCRDLSPQYGMVQFVVAGSSGQ